MEYCTNCQYLCSIKTLQTLGALFAGNYFGGEVDFQNNFFLFPLIMNHPKVATLAQDLLESVQWSDAIEAADSPRIFPVGQKNTFFGIILKADFETNFTDPICS